MWHRARILCANLVHCMRISRRFNRCLKLCFVYLLYMRSWTQWTLNMPQPFAHTINQKQSSNKSRPSEHKFKNIKPPLQWTLIHACNPIKFHRLLVRARRHCWLSLLAPLFRTNSTNIFTTRHRISRQSFVEIAPEKLSRQKYAFVHNSHGVDCGMHKTRNTESLFSHRITLSHYDRSIKLKALQINWIDGRVEREVMHSIRYAQSFHQ